MNAYELKQSVKNAVRQALNSNREVIKEEKTNMGNGESKIKRGVYKTSDGYEWLTYTRSGTCKSLDTAMRKAGF